MIDTSRRRTTWSYWLVAAVSVAAAVNGLALDPDDPATLYVCTTNVSAIVWRTTDAGAHWTRYDLPRVTGNACDISVAPDNPARVSLQVVSTNQQPQSCATTFLYLSDDRGASWRAVTAPASPVPAAATDGWCSLQVTARQLLLLYSFYGSASATQQMLLERSDDGAHWTLVGGALTSESLYNFPLVGPGNTLALLAMHPQSDQRPYGTDLIVSTDGGQTWRTWSQPPDLVGTFLLSAPPTEGGPWPTASRPFYALSQEQIPSDLYREGVFASADGKQWDELPALPVPGLSADQRGILQVLAALPDGRLAAWGADPRTGVPARVTVPEVATSFWLWLWDPGTHQWRIVPTPLSVTADEGCGRCWQSASAEDRAGASYLYVWSFVVNPQNTLPGLFRIRVPR
jgi:hypothetical protein